MQSAIKKMSRSAMLVLAIGTAYSSSASAARIEQVYGSGFWADSTTATVIAVNQAISICQTNGGTVLFGYQVHSMRFIHPNWFVNVSINCQYP